MALDNFPENNSKALSQVYDEELGADALDFFDTGDA
jgi:hypothetical protein